MNQRMAYLLTIAFAIVFIFIGNRMVADRADFDEFAHQTERAVVLEISERIDEDWGFDEWSMPSTRIIFEARIRGGERRGEIITAMQFMDHFSTMGYANEREIIVGDSVLLAYLPDHDEPWNFIDFVRSDRLLVFIVIFAIFLLILGGRKGINTILSLGIICSAIFLVFIPAILSGRNIYLTAIVICAFTVVVTLLIIYGLNRKSIAAIIGCLGGILMAGIIAVIMERVLFLTGHTDSEMMALLRLPIETPINLRAIVFAAILIGAMGAIMDTALSISTALWEVRENAPGIKFEALMKSGMNIGRDMMGTMTNTLILAYIGGSLSVVLLLSVFSPSMLSLFNMEMIVVEVLQAVIGSMGILFAVPITSLVCAALYSRGD